MSKPLIGPSTRRPDGERVAMNVAWQVRDRLRTLLYEPEMRGVGYSEFLARAVEEAETEIAEARTTARLDEVRERHARLRGERWPG